MCGLTREEPEPSSGATGNSLKYLNDRERRAQVNDQPEGGWDVLSRDEKYQWTRALGLLRVPVVRGARTGSSGGSAGGVSGLPADDKVGDLVKMIATFFPLKKLRRNGKYVFGVILVVGALAIYNGNGATKAKAWDSNVGKSAAAHAELATQQVCHKNFY